MYNHNRSAQPFSTDGQSANVTGILKSLSGIPVPRSPPRERKNNGPKINYPFNPNSTQHTPNSPNLHNTPQKVGAQNSAQKFNQHKPTPTQNHTHNQSTPATSHKPTANSASSLAHQPRELTPEQRDYQHDFIQKQAEHQQSMYNQTNMYQKNVTPPGPERTPQTSGGTSASVYSMASSNNNNQRDSSGYETNASPVSQMQSLSIKTEQKSGVGNMHREASPGKQVKFSEHNSYSPYSQNGQQNLQQVSQKPVMPQAMPKSQPMQVMNNGADLKFSGRKTVVVRKVNWWLEALFF